MQQDANFITADFLYLFRHTRDETRFVPNMAK